MTAIRMLQQQSATLERQYRSSYHQCFPITLRRFENAKFARECTARNATRTWRCMLRLQQYEHLLKTVVATLEIRRPLDEIANAQFRQENLMSKKPLGELVGTSTGDCLAESDASTELEAAAVSPRKGKLFAPWFEVRHAIVMSSELREQTTAALAELVAMRNNLVHLLIEQFDVSDVSGCLAATGYLRDCYEKANAHLRKLEGGCWTEKCESIGGRNNAVNGVREFRGKRLRRRGNTLAGKCDG